MCGRALPSTVHWIWDPVSKLAPGSWVASEEACHLSADTGRDTDKTSVTEPGGEHQQTL